MTRELTFTRIFDAPRQRVWDAITRPEELAKWWGPDHFHTPLDTITVDLRPGGAFHLTMVGPDGTRYPSEMTWRAVEPIDRLVYGWERQTTGVDEGEVELTFADLPDGRTEMTHRYVGEISDEMFPMMEKGSDQQWSRLEALLS